MLCPVLNHVYFSDICLSGKALFYFENLPFSFKIAKDRSLTQNRLALKKNVFYTFELSVVLMHELVYFMNKMNKIDASMGTQHR